MGYKVLGIDESNHGKFPEVFAGVLSFDPRDSEFSEKKLGKKRNSRRSVEDWLSHRPFRYVKMTRHFKETNSLHSLDLMLLSSASLIKASSVDEPLNKVLIDGNLSSEMIEGLYRMIHPLNPHIYASESGDQHYPVVNLADLTAYKLYYSLLDKRRHAYKSYAIIPDINRYDKNSFYFDSTNKE